MFYQSPFAGSMASEIIHNDTLNSRCNDHGGNTYFYGSKITENFFS